MSQIESWFVLGQLSERRKRQIQGGEELPALPIEEEVTKIFFILKQILVLKKIHHC